MLKNKKKEKKKLVKNSLMIGVSSIMVLVWLVISITYCAIVMISTKNIAQSTAQKNFDNLVKRIDSNVTTSYDFVNQYIYIAKCHLDYLFTIDRASKITCGADGLYDSDMQIVAYITDKYNFPIMDTDKSIYTTYSSTAGNVFDPDYEDSTSAVSFVASGLIDYDSFRNSMTKEQFDSISKYLNTKKDINGYYYELMCTEYYYDKESERIIPKTVEIVRTLDSNIWYSQDIPVETYELTPANVENLLIGTISETQRNIIPGQFVMGTFSSGGLIKDPYGMVYNNDYDPYTGKNEKVSPFTYVYYDHDTITIESPVANGQYFTGYSNYLESFSDDTIPKDITIHLKFAKRINILKECKITLITGIALISLFSLIIGFSLAGSLWEIMKTQMIEEEKRREITNALAHDIKTPLFIISGYAQNLKENINEEKRDHYIDRIIERTNEVNSLVHKMLDFSKLGNSDQELYLEPVNVNKLVDSAVIDYNNLPDTKSIRINSKKELNINADKNMLQRAISYLIDNAVKYSLDGTDINIEISNYTLSISNACEYISPQDIKHLTEPYFRVEKNRESKGNGLGLSIVKSIVDLHHFNLSTEFEDGIITFTIKF